MNAAKRFGVEALGWFVLVVGIILMPLPGPGLIIVFAGLLLLSQRYEWASRRVEPVRLRAMKAAAEGVLNWQRIVISTLGVLTIVAAGVLWITGPPIPQWWGLPDWTWLPGGAGVGIGQIASAAFAAGLIIYSFSRYYGRPEEIDKLREQIAVADDWFDGEPEGAALGGSESDSEDQRTSD